MWLGRQVKAFRKTYFFICIKVRNLSPLNYRKISWKAQKPLRDEIFPSRLEYATYVRTNKNDSHEGKFLQCYSSESTAKWKEWANRNGGGPPWLYVSESACTSIISYKEYEDSQPARQPGDTTGSLSLSLQLVGIQMLWNSQGQDPFYFISLCAVCQLIL